MVWYKKKHVCITKISLDERSQIVSCSEYQSNCENIDVGVPQCSVLGPLLFLIYINDLQNITSLKVLNLADNTLLYTTFKKKTHIYRTLTTLF